MSTSNTGVVQFLHLDHQGGFLFSTYANGGLASYQNYGPWGDTHVTSGAQPTDINFTGQRLDATGLLDYNARKYNQGVARFIGADSILPNKYSSGSINRYSYVTNNPVNYNDPTGHYASAPGGGVGRPLCDGIYACGYGSGIPGATQSTSNSGDPSISTPNPCPMTQCWGVQLPYAPAQGCIANADYHWDDNDLYFTPSVVCARSAQALYGGWTWQGQYAFIGTEEWQDAERASGSYRASFHTAGPYADILGNGAEYKYHFAIGPSKQRVVLDFSVTRSGQGTQGVTLILGPMFN